MEIKCYLSNCIFYIKEKLSLEIDGYEIKIIQNEEIDFFKRNEYKNKWVESTTLIFQCDKESDISDVREIAQNLTHLMSFATLSPVRFYKMEKDDLLIWKNHAQIGVYNIFRPIINFVNDDIKKYLEITYPSFKKYKESRKLNIVIEYLVSSENLKLPLELKLATIFITLENLKKTYAEECKYHFIEGVYCRSFKYENNKKVPNDKLSFKALLIEMFNKFNINKNLKHIVNLRNEIIHSGFSQTSYENQISIYEKCHDLIHLYLLSLLEYEGNYFVYSTASINMERL